MTKQEFKNKKETLKNKFKDICNKSMQLLNRVSGDLFVIIGLILINKAFYKLSDIVGLIISGSICITLGYLINSNKRGDN